jgi:deoxyadenosine/deoxycytidine kinase
MTTIAIAGGIAVGKTTLQSEIQKQMNHWGFVEEKPEKALFLKEFYADKGRWAFHSRMGMLAYFHERTGEKDGTDIVVSDRCIHELIVFARVQKQLGTLSDQEFQLYVSIYQAMCATQQLPDKIIRCVCSNEEASKRVQKRARDFENKVDIQYLELVEKQYDAWLNELPSTINILVLDTSMTNYVDTAIKFAKATAM